MQIVISLNRNKALRIIHHHKHLTMSRSLRNLWTYIEFNESQLGALNRARSAEGDVKQISSAVGDIIAPHVISVGLNFKDLLFYVDVLLVDLGNNDYLSMRDTLGKTGVIEITPPLVQPMHPFIASGDLPINKITVDLGGIVNAREAGDVLGDEEPLLSSKDNLPFRFPDDKDNQE